MQGFPPALLDSSNPCSPLSLKPSETAVLILDLHNFILDHQADKGSGTIAAVRRLLQFSRRHGFRIAHCLLDTDASTPSHFKMSSRTNAIGQSLRATPEMAREHSDLRPAGDSDEPTFTRLPGVVSARGSYGIKDWMAKEGIKGLVLAGLSSSGCVLSTAKDAADRGYIVTVVEDCCADRDPKVHEIIMTKLLVLQCHVVSLESWEEVVSRNVGAGRVSVRQ